MGLKNTTFDLNNKLLKLINGIYINYRTKQIFI